MNTHPYFVINKLRHTGEDRWVGLGKRDQA